MRRLVVRTDGAARGNPGPAGAGWVVETAEGSIVAEGCAFLGSLTNNQAEYEALLLGLQAADPDRETEIEVYADSELMVRQLTGEYRVKNEDLKPRWFRALEALERSASWSAHHVPRAENAAADALANQAIDAWNAVEAEAAGPEGG